MDGPSVSCEGRDAGVTGVEELRVPDAIRMDDASTLPPTVQKIIHATETQSSAAHSHRFLFFKFVNQI